MELKLKAEMDMCEQQLASNPNEDTHQHYSTVKKQLEEINNYTARGVYIRAQAKYIEQNELNTKLFLGIERARSKNKNISKLINDQKEEITNPDDILKLEQLFYENLYKEKVDYQGAEATEAKKYFLDQPCEQLAETDQINLDTNISDQEIANALKELPSHKSPGGDGFSIDFYNFFLPDIKSLGEMSIEQKRAVLTLVP